jgi:hypothetical protein
MRRLLIALLALVSCSACLRATTTITVRQDGSGTIDQEIGMSPQARAMLGSMGAAAQGGSAQGGAMPGGAPPQIFGEAQAQRMASAMSVRFVSGEPIKTAELEGYRAHYAFDDIRKVQLNADGAAAAGLSQGANSKPPFGFEFDRGAQSSLLTIHLPESGTLPRLPQLPGAAANNPQENAQALSLMTTMMRGLFVDITLAVDGRVIKTTAPYVTGSKITLLQMDLDKLLASEGALQKLQNLSDPAALKDMPGVRVVTSPSVVVQFGR